MRIKIKECKGYALFYDQGRKVFVLHDGGNNEVAAAPTEAELENKADKLFKQNWQFPIEAISNSGGQIYDGRITSVNPDSRTMIFVPFDHSASRSKLFLSDNDVYECTQHNAEIRSKIRELQAQSKEIHRQIFALKSQLEKPIGLEYFGLS